MVAPGGKNQICVHAHAQEYTRPRMIEVTAVLLLINEDTEGRRGHDKTYVPISTKGRTLTAVLLSGPVHYCK